ncbi:PSP1 domain-containing protein [Stratiformator vulcanicus]|nr:regulatory iron-sulfur-containing complex subunit RicT [Stratiformator vulcanicus]
MSKPDTTTTAMDADVATATPERAPTAYVVRYGIMRHLGEFSVRGADRYRRGDEVVVRTNRGVEWGEVLCPAGKRTRKFLGGDSGSGKILREVSVQDRQSRDEAAPIETQFFREADEMIREWKMQMKLVECERILGGERLLFYYVAEQRVDFRELVKAMAKRFKCRIELRQIGVRDEAKLLADYGDCGKPVCCNTHLTEMPPVSMKMAKLQKATLDPNKISGRCGRLKCCLRYEYDTYEAHRKELPKVGATAVTKIGEGKVIAQELLARKVIVQYEGGRRVLTDEAEILTVIKGGNRDAKKSSQQKPTDNPAAGADSQKDSEQ